MVKTRLVSIPDFSKAARRLKSDVINYQRELITPNDFLIAWAKNKKFHIETYGCQANVRDSEIIRNMLLKLNMIETFEFSDADFILFNTCAIRENAQNHLYGELGRAKDRYNKDKNVIVAICGCVMQQEKALQYVIEHFPYVKLIFGTNNISSFYSLLNDVVKDNERIVDVRSNSLNVEEGYELTDRGRESKYSAFVNIMYGCDKFCTYCIVPYTRGKERSRKEEDIIAEVNCLKEKGYKQVTLLGQNVDAYGKDFNDEYAFAKLLEKVAQTGIDRVMFVTPYPSDFKFEVFDVMAKYKNIMPYLHLPVQSGSNDILKKMNRRYTREEYLNIVRELRQRLPDVFLSTDIIVGFPNETEKDFEDTLSLVKEADYDSAYTFIFSPREGTLAAKIKDETTDSVKHERFNRLKELIDKQTQKRAQTFVGKTLSVLFEKVSDKNPDMISGYDMHNKLVHVKGNASLIGQIKNVKITSSHTYSLIGDVIDD